MTDFKWRQFQGEIILGCVRWYCKYGISYPTEAFLKAVEKTCRGRQGCADIGEEMVGDKSSGFAVVWALARLQAFLDYGAMCRTAESAFTHFGNTYLAYGLKHNSEGDIMAGKDMKAMAKRGYTWRQWIDDWEEVVADYTPYEILSEHGELRVKGTDHIVQ